ncbi:hypothetical protein CDAR_541661 [Caerostris darwini]|uniref:FLYWCH-type domain-containing protein n=1 Tax=Caerostris darwini TaxID=1538125 RepID=A0AAV4UU94_9ARAC|nr:hypothetical protein CDAR_541661 [Caerostris darwini]
MVKIDKSGFMRYAFSGLGDTWCQAKDKRVWRCRLNTLCARKDEKILVTSHRVKDHSKPQLYLATNFRWICVHKNPPFPHTMKASAGAANIDETDHATLPLESTSNCHITNNQNK